MPRLIATATIVTALAALALPAVAAARTTRAVTFTRQMITVTTRAGLGSARAVITHDPYRLAIERSGGAPALRKVFTAARRR